MPVLKRFGVVTLLTLVVFAVSQSGCAWRRARTNVADMFQRVDRVQPGSTTASELVSILGSPPNNVLELSGNRSVFIYTFGDSKTESFNIILLEITRSNVGIDSALFVLQGDVVEKVYVSTNSKDLAWQFWAWGD